MDCSHCCIKGSESLTFNYVHTTIVDISDLNREGYSVLKSLLDKAELTSLFW